MLISYLKGLLYSEHFSLLINSARLLITYQSRALKFLIISDEKVEAYRYVNL